MLDWAVRNLEALDASEHAFHRKRPYGVWGDRDPDTKEQRVRISVAEFLDPPAHWVLQLGDIAHNMRVSLDYLAHAAVEAETPRLSIPPKQAGNIAFPISPLGEADFRSRNGNFLKYASENTRNAVELLKPYRGGDGACSWNLYALQEIDNPHKHRHLLAAAPNVTNVEHAVRGTGVFAATRWGLEGPFKDGAVVGRGHVIQGVDGSKTNVEVQVVFQIAFGDVGPATGFSAIPLLKEIAENIRNIVFPIVEASYLKP